MWALERAVSTCTLDITVCIVRSATFWPERLWVNRWVFRMPHDLRLLLSTVEEIHGQIIHAQRRVGVCESQLGQHAVYLAHINKQLEHLRLGLQQLKDTSPVNPTTIIAQQGQRAAMERLHPDSEPAAPSIQDFVLTAQVHDTVKVQEAVVAVNMSLFREVVTDEVPVPEDDRLTQEQTIEEWQDPVNEKTLSVQPSEEASGSHVSSACLRKSVNNSPKSSFSFASAGMKREERRDHSSEREPSAKSADRLLLESQSPQDRLVFAAGSATGLLGKMQSSAAGWVISSSLLFSRLEGELEARKSEVTTASAHSGSSNETRTIVVARTWTKPPRSKDVCNPMCQV